MSVLNQLRSAARRAARLVRRSLIILRDGGWSQFVVYFREEVVLNSLLVLEERIRRPRKMELMCSVCGYESSRFMAHVGAGYTVRNAMCPRCGSFPRHRGFALLLNDHLVGRLSRLPSTGGFRLLFAPEPSMKDLLTPHVGDLTGVDLNQINDLVSFREDIMDLSFDDDSVEFLSCFHVVEHVPDDELALRELRRVLHPRGLAIVNVPISFGRWQSISFGYPNPLLNDHFFDYGEDFSVKLSAAGLGGIGYRLSELVDAGQFARLALQDELIFVLEKADAPARVSDHTGKSLLQPTE